MQALSEVGLENVAITRRFQPFESTSKHSLARKFGVIGANVVATKPAAQQTAATGLFVKALAPLLPGVRSISRSP